VPEGRVQLLRALGLAALAWGILSFQILALFFRPSPYGGPYAAEWYTYLFHALTFRLLTVWGVALPFFAWWLWRASRLTGRVERAVLHGLLTALLGILVVYDHADNEVMRFMGTHLTSDFLRTYGAAGLGQSEVLQSLADDRGGPFSSVALLLLGPFLLLGGARRWWRRPIGAGRLARGGAVVLAVWLPLLGGLLVYNLPGGRFRRERVQGAALTQVRELINGRRAGARPPEFAELAREYQREWLAEDGTGAWRFVGDTAFPLRRVPAEPMAPPDGGGWNIIYLQLETFRGWNVGHLRPDLTEPSPTPFLDSLARSPDAAYWTRALSYGPPTINGFMAAQCSIPPHSRFHIATRFTLTRLDCLPEVLRRHRWRTLFFTASDPDWDNQTPWLRRWYDETHYYPDAAEADRVVFRRAAERIRSVAAQGQRFMATVSSISNHYPFHSREPEFTLNPEDDPREAIRNTMRYTDDVVREFVAALATEPWFDRTVLVVAGDHGYNLGEHDGEPGQRSGFRESLWIPLIIAGRHPALPRGVHTGVASLLELAPTMAELAGIREPTSWVGHSLLNQPPPSQRVGLVRPTMLFAESGRFSLVGDPARGTGALFDVLADPLQQHDLAAWYPDSVAGLWRGAERRTRLLDYLVAANRVVPEEEGAGGPGGTAPDAHRAAAH